MIVDRIEMAETFDDASFDEADGRTVERVSASDEFDARDSADTCFGYAIAIGERIFDLNNFVYVVRVEV